MADELLDRGSSRPSVSATRSRDEIGRGGMGVVFRARDVRLRRSVAIKVLPPELAFRDEVRSRFLREAQTAAQLSHPNIVPIYSVDEVNGLVCFVMALVEGESLGAYLKREGRAPIDFTRRGSCATWPTRWHTRMRAAIIHRDIKPDNILIDRVTGRTIVSDFGIARAAEGDSRLTATGIAVGTPAYMSPEQAIGEREIDGRSDLYSLGSRRLPDARRRAAVRGDEHAVNADEAHQPDAAADSRASTRPARLALRMESTGRWPSSRTSAGRMPPHFAMR